MHKENRIAKEIRTTGNGIAGCLTIILMILLLLVRFTTLEGGVAPDFILVGAFFIFELGRKWLNYEVSILELFAESGVVLVATAVAFSFGLMLDHFYDTKMVSAQIFLLSVLGLFGLFVSITYLITHKLRVQNRWPVVKDLD